MASCEKCWWDAGLRAMEDFSKSKVEHYVDLLKERIDNPCSAREMAGQWWNEEKQCDSRKLCFGGD